MPMRPAAVYSSCAIATAAYGSPLEKELDVLRYYRDNTLISTRLGRNLVHGYYRISPPIAYTIHKSEKLKRVVRAGLNPIVKFLKRKQLEKGAEYRKYSLNEFTKSVDDFVY